jgi:hypothetical protein
MPPSDSVPPLRVISHLISPPLCVFVQDPRRPRLAGVGRAIERLTLGATVLSYLVQMDNGVQLRAPRAWVTPLLTISAREEELTIPPPPTPWPPRLFDDVATGDAA